MFKFISMHLNLFPSEKLPFEITFNDTHVSTDYIYYFKERGGFIVKEFPS